MQQGKAGFTIIRLLRHHAIQANHAPFQPRHRGTPQRHAIALAAKARPHDVKANKAKAGAVIGGGNAANGLAIQ